jgi:hypothetical protein
VQQDVAEATALGDDVMAKIVGTSLDKQSEITALAADHRAVRVSVVIWLPKQPHCRAMLTAIRRAFGLHRFGFAVAGVDVGRRLPVGVTDDIAAHPVGAPGRREATRRHHFSRLGA